MFHYNESIFMKKLMLTVAGMLFVSLMAVNAQVTQDTTDVTGQNPTEQSGVYSDDQSNYTRDMEVVQPTDVPTSLRSTLEGTEYSGWEQGKVYRNTTTNEYLIVIGDEDAKVYRFDANGSRIEDLDQPEQSGDFNQSGDQSGDMDDTNSTNDDANSTDSDVNNSGTTGTTSDDQTTGTGTR
jgi:hypothetical protein